MSSSDEAPEDVVDTDDVGGLDEIVPPQLMPIWSRVRLVQDFRRTYGNKYIRVMEAIIAIVLTVGYLYWLLLYFGG